MRTFNSHQCQRGAEAAALLAKNAKTDAECQHWEKMEKVWRTRWRQLDDR